MKHTLDQLDKAIAGTVVMSSALEAMASKFLDDRVPAQWEAVAYPSLKPLGSWVADLLERAKFLAAWLYEGTPATYWVPSFFFPQGFMTAALQTYARSTQTPIDALQFRACVREFFAEGCKEAPEVGVNVHGLFLQGARWDMNKKVIEDSKPKEPIEKFPVVQLVPVPITENLEAGCYSCPFYKTSTRRGELSTTGHSTNFVLYMHIPTQKPADYWVRRGAALLAMTDD